MTIGKAVYEPGWKFPVDVSSSGGAKFCEEENLVRLAITPFIASIHMPQFPITSNQ